MALCLQIWELDQHIFVFTSRMALIVVEFETEHSQFLFNHYYWFSASFILAAIQRDKCQLPSGHMIYLFRIYCASYYVGSIILEANVGS